MLELAAGMLQPRPTVMRPRNRPAGMLQPRNRPAGMLRPWPVFAGAGCGSATTITDCAATTGGMAASGARGTRAGREQRHHAGSGGRWEVVGGVRERYGSGKGIFFSGSDGHMCLDPMHAR